MNDFSGIVLRGTPFNKYYRGRDVVITRNSQKALFAQLTSLCFSVICEQKFPYLEAIILSTLFQTGFELLYAPLGAVVKVVDVLI